MEEKLPKSKSNLMIDPITERLSFPRAVGGELIELSACDALIWEVDPMAWMIYSNSLIPQCKQHNNDKSTYYTVCKELTYWLLF